MCALLGLICFILLSEVVLAFDNAPDGPNSETPDKRRYYNFLAIPDSTRIFTKSHYSTHDWIADAALRLLIDEPDSSLKDWSWLIDEQVRSNNLPKWVNQYGDRVNHYRVRSYMSFLYATQLPDMDPDDCNAARPHRNPKTIDIWWEEGELIGNGQGTGSWVGRSDYQQFHWTAIPIGDNQYIFVPKGYNRAPEYAYITAKEAIRCLVPEKKSDEGWAKPESAACWLGVMSHFISDLASPAHLIQANEDYYPKSPKFHDWFENQVAKHTLWDPSRGGPKGYQSDNNFFKIDMAIIEKDAQNIIPIPPYIAASTCASDSIYKSYGHLNEGGLFIKQGDLEQENLIKLSSSTYWNWGDIGKERNSYIEIIPGSLTYKQYYDKVEYLLNTAIYYTAAAMKWVMYEVKKSNNGQKIECDQWAKKFFKEKYPEEERPVENPYGFKLDEILRALREYFKNYKPNIIVTLAMLAPILALTFIPIVIVVVLKVH